MSDKIYNIKRATFTPDYDLFLWYWYGDPDPGFLLSVLSPGRSAAGATRSGATPSTTSSTSAADDHRPRGAQAAHLEDAADRLREGPYITLTYPEWLESYNDKQWTGWVKSPSVNGPVIYTEYNIDSYLFAHPQQAAAQASGGGSTGVIIGVVVVAAIAVLGVVAVVLVRRRRRAGGGMR